jgi:hypothetical protein
MKFENLGRLDRNSDVKLIKLEDEKIIALYGWNGEQYTKCWESDELGYLNGKDNLTATPIDEYNEELDQWETIGIKIQ